MLIYNFVLALHEYYLRYSALPFGPPKNTVLGHKNDNRFLAIEYQHQISLKHKMLPLLGNIEASTLNARCRLTIRI